MGGGDMGTGSNRRSWSGGKKRCFRRTDDIGGVQPPEAVSAGLRGNAPRAFFYFFGWPVGASEERNKSPIENEHGAGHFKQEQLRLRKRVQAAKWGEWSLGGRGG